MKPRRRKFKNFSASGIFRFEGMEVLNVKDVGFDEFIERFNLACVKYGFDLEKKLKKLL